MSKSLDETFDITPTPDVELPKPIKKPKTIIVSDRSEDKEKDYNYARQNLYNMVERMTDAVEGALQVAEDSEHPRAFEVALNGAKATAEVVEKLNDLHKKMNDLEKEDPTPQTTQVQNNMFVGSTAELMAMLKDSK